MRIINLASGSKGNATLIESENTAILIDCGVALSKLEALLVDANCDINRIEAVFITHTHIDHIKGLDRFAKKYKVLVFATDKCFEDGKLSFVSSLKRNYLQCEKEVEYKDLKIIPFLVEHDASQTVGFRISNNNKSFSLVTDVGHITKENIMAMAGSSLIFIESNHDLRMLLNGPYPRDLKLRIMSNNGHLSNSDCAVAIKELVKLGTKHFVLMHISEINNDPIFAYTETIDVLKKENLDKNIFIGISHQDRIGNNFLLKSDKEN